MSSSIYDLPLSQNGFWGELLKTPGTCDKCGGKVEANNDVKVLDAIEKGGKFGI